MTGTQVAIATPDGAARAFVFMPRGQGPWPAVILYMDAIAIRPALFEMAERLAGHGYYVLLPDMFWRAGDYPEIDAKRVFADEALRAELFTKLMPSTDPEKAMRDTGAFLAWLAAQPLAKPGPMGVTGYCMGAGVALRAAGTYPDKVAACAGFHGGRLATDDAASPHLLAPQIKAEVYMAGADNDSGFPPEQADRLREALTGTGVANTVLIYQGAAHGWVPSDAPVHNPEAAERHWTALFDLLDRNLKG
jgi:carboxymethylenebutenolidase